MLPLEKNGSDHGHISLDLGHATKHAKITIFFFSMLHIYFLTFNISEIIFGKLLISP